ncbi:MAG: hypothetical protein RLO18_08300, partial [Gimesia chilikensis]
QIRIPKFDMTSIIIMTSDQGLIENLRRKIAGISAQSAEACVQMSSAKLKRCEQTNALLVNMGVSQIARLDGPAILERSRKLSAQAEQSLASKDYHRARVQARDAMQLLRILQRSQWREATHNFDSAVTSPYTIAYSTLPDHWRMIEQIGRSSGKIQSNLLRSGDFEDIDTMTAEGWKHKQNPITGTQAIAELYPRDRKSGNFSLR